MSRRRKQKDSTLDDLFELLKDAPIWLGPVLALVLLVFVRFICPLFFTAKEGSPDIGMVVRQSLPGLSWIVAGVVMVVWLVAELHKLTHRPSRNDRLPIAPGQRGLPKSPMQQPSHGHHTEMKADSLPTCPACGANMILRTARRGKNAGTQFWGCSRYPECEGKKEALTR